ncbi:sigma-54-dependent Fis family transcriptional regulator [Spirillospora sp. CA-128828]|uniref:sigma-54-dependent Fis family transcriptional regulator n=1 Tax=Spirillospora sp. CA-128828 TaxID=3240033 RepID=UPI003D8E8763
MVDLRDLDDKIRDPLRPEIASSWRRSQLSGLDPGDPVGRLTFEEVNDRCRLVVAADPVLDDMERTLDRTGFAVILADRQSRILDMRCGDRPVRTALERTGGMRGRLFSEENTGTNSIATAYELRRGIAVHGTEHYLEAFKKFSCYGHPILHPVTHRLEGVLDITCLAVDDSPLLAPFLIRAARDIQARLLEGSRHAEQRMLARYQEAATQHPDRPVLVLGDGVVLANPAAVDLLQASDHALLRALTGDLRDDRGRLRDIELACGRTARVRFERIPGTGGGALFELDAPDDRPRRSLPVPRGRAASVRRPGRAGELNRIRTHRLPVLITGEPGTGRTTTARELAGDAPVLLVAAARLDEEGDSAWLARLAESLHAPDGLTVLDDVHLLPADTAARAGRLLEGRPGWFAMTGAPADGLGAEQRALAARCVERIDLPPLRRRIDELPQLVAAALAEAGAAGNVRFTAAALEALASHSWPGNLRELDAVVRTVLEHRSGGDITVRDLPGPYRISARTRRLGDLERAERDAILTALRACGGNKVHTAERLGISRTTLYNRIRALGIVA